MWCWRRLLRVPWMARRSNQSILKEISHEYLLEGLMLKLKLQYFGYLLIRADSFEKTLMLEKIEGRRRGWQRVRWPTQWTWVWVDSGSWWWTGRPGMLQFMGSQRIEHDWANWDVIILTLHISRHKELATVHRGPFHYWTIIFFLNSPFSQILHRQKKILSRTLDATK